MDIVRKHNVMPLGSSHVHKMSILLVVCDSGPLLSLVVVDLSLLFVPMPYFHHSWLILSSTSNDAMVQKSTFLETHDSSLFKGCSVVISVLRSSTGHTGSFCDCDLQTHFHCFTPVLCCLLLYLFQGVQLSHMIGMCVAPLIICLFADGLQHPAISGHLDASFLVFQF